MEAGRGERSRKEKVMEQEEEDVRRDSAEREEKGTS